MTPFTKGVTRGDICAFIYGFFVFLSEVSVTVESILHFMPGMRIAISTDPGHFSVYNRWVMPARVVLACRNETRAALLYLCRTFP